jgi:hypothetical protein
MPRILVITEPVHKPESGVMLDEHIATSDLASDHFAGQLIERISWALADAEHSERAPFGGSDAAVEQPLASMLAPETPRPRAHAVA